MSLTADILVIGLGAVGSAALYQSAKLGASVIGIDRFTPPHDRGSSHGDTRITRQAIGEGREFVPLVLRSNQIWEELEAATGVSLLTRNGGLVLASAGTPGTHHGSTSFVQDTIATAVEFNIAHEVLRPAKMQARYPQFHLRGDEAGYFESGAGFLRPERCIATQLSLARQFGAQIFNDEIALDIKPASAGTVEVISNQRTFVAGKVLLTAGPWIPKLLSENYTNYFRVYRQSMSWFALTQNRDRYTPESFPIFIWITGNRPRDMMYGFPAVDGPDGGMKLATEQYEETADPDSPAPPSDDAAIATMFAEYVAPRFPDLSGRVLRSTTCLYTVTPDAKFIVDHFRNDQFGKHENVWFASACSGHGFKHSAALGEALARQAWGQPSAIDLAPFRLPDATA
jgi:sarcosine oxidase